MRFDVITLFPEAIAAMTDTGVTGRAIRDGLVALHTWNPRDYATDRHRSVDDRPYGGGPGMVMTVEPLRSAIRAAREAHGASARVSLMSPQGRRLDQAAVRSLAERPGMILLCGRYEGIDERLIDLEVDEEWSLGDYVISGGELAAAVMIDAVGRLVPGVLGDEDSAAQDSFSEHLLDHPHYTRPESVGNRVVPEVLVSGDHEAIRRWRRKQALGRTWQRRPELLQAGALNEEDRRLLDEYRREQQSDSN
ncbi:MAG: tRNA (guanosine(37)-N1)-methyltransferase TrmD [Xanthomonadales bacterium]|nr:tRNA (guanosine(37)-N1)-methyltransferase TrmD [Xanthomonadales bacterium]